MSNKNNPEADTFDLVAVGSPPEQTDWHPNTLLVGLQKPWEAEQQLDLPCLPHPAWGHIIPRTRSSGWWPPTPCVQDVRDPGGGQRLHVELILHWSPRNKEKVTALMKPGAQWTHGDSQKFSGPISTIDGYRGMWLWSGRSFWPCKLDFLPLENEIFFFFQIPENLLGIDILWGQTLSTSSSEICPWARVIKPVPTGNQ